MSIDLPPQLVVIAVLLLAAGGALLGGGIGAASRAILRGAGFAVLLFLGAAGAGWVALNGGGVLGGGFVLLGAIVFGLVLGSGLRPGVKAGG